MGPIPVKPFDEERLEDLLFRSAELVLERHRPALLLLHPIDTDAQQHRHGREHPEVADAFERVDRAIGRLRARIAALGLAEETLFVVTGDHGFFQTHTSIHMNARLREAGLLEVGSGRRRLELSSAGLAERWFVFSDASRSRGRRASAQGNRNSRRRNARGTSCRRGRPWSRDRSSTRSARCPTLSSRSTRGKAMPSGRTWRDRS